MIKSRKEYVCDALKIDKLVYVAENFAVPKFNFDFDISVYLTTACTQTNCIRRLLTKNFIYIPKIKLTCIKNSTSEIDPMILHLLGIDPLNKYLTLLERAKEGDASYEATDAELVLWNLLAAYGVGTEFAFSYAQQNTESQKSLAAKIDAEINAAPAKSARTDDQKLWSARIRNKSLLNALLSTANEAALPPKVRRVRFRVSIWVFVFTSFFKRFF